MRIVNRCGNSSICRPVISDAKEGLSQFKHAGVQELIINWRRLCIFNKKKGGD